MALKKFSPCKEAANTLLVITPCKEATENCHCSIKCLLSHEEHQLQARKQKLI